MGIGEIDITGNKRLVEYSDKLYMLETFYKHTKQLDERLLSDILDRYKKLSSSEKNIGIHLLARSIEYLSSNKLEDRVA